MPKAFRPELMWNYSPVIRPQPPLALDDVCGDNPVCVSFACEFIPYLLGLLEIYRWPDRFQGTPAEQEYSAGLFRDLMEVLAMACCCDGSSSVTLVIEHRFSIYGEMQISIDGGETWQQDPEDPRIPVPALPPYVNETNSFTKCDAASNALDNLKDVQADCANKLQTGLTAIDLALALIVAIAGAVLFAPAGIPALVGIIYALASAIKDMTIEAYNALFTEDIWNKTVCAIYCHIGDNGQFNQAQFDQLLVHLNNILPGRDNPLDVSANMRSFFRVWGLKGLNNACAIGAQATADCSDCDCPECEQLWDFLITGDYPEVTIIAGTEVIGQGIEINHPEGQFGDFYAHILFVFSQPCNARYLEITSHFATGSAANNYFEVATERDGNGNLVWVQAGTWSMSNGNSTSGGMIFTPDIDPVPRLAFRINVWDGGYQTGGAYIKTVELRNTP